MFKKIRNLLVNGIASSLFMPKVLRWIVYRASGMNIKTRAIYSGCFFGGSKISIGWGSNVNHDCFFDTSSHIQIGERCFIAMGVMFCTSSHKLGDSNCRAGEADNAPIVVENGCWIGARALILPGVTIGHGTVVAAGAVVVKDCDPNGLYAGLPAKKIKDLGQ